MSARKGSRVRSRKPSRASPSKRSDKRPRTKRSGGKNVPTGTKYIQPSLRVRRPSTRPIQRPGRWWREPIQAEKLRDLSADEAGILVAQERLLRTETLKQQIRELREFTTEFDASDGYLLETRKLIRLPSEKIRKIRRVHSTLKHAQSQPHVIFSAKTDKQRKAARLRAGQILPGQKRFLIHHGDAAKARAEWRDGEIQVTTAVKGGELYERIYYFSRRPRSWDEVVNQTAKLERRGMRTGYYKIFNTIYGPIGELVSVDALRDSLEQFFSAYNKWLAGTILGWIWMSTSLDVARRKQRRHKTTAERFQDNRARLAQREQDALKRRLGMKVPKRRSRRKR